MLRCVMIFLLFLLGIPVPPSIAARHMSEEAILFRQVRSGVATIFGDQGSGSGFLVDSLGILLTNDHVVGGSSRIRVKFDDSTRVEAELLATDPKKDIAAIRVSPKVCSPYAILPLAEPSDTMVFEGEKVIAIGSPLHQEKVMTAGIVSKVEPTAVISDVNINHGNSGGPLVNMDGNVIAINTFGDFTDQGGPGVSGSILISQARDVLEKARARAQLEAPPSNKLLPVAPTDPFPLDSLQAVALMEKFDHVPYEVSELVGTGKFNVMVVTPIYDAWRSNQYALQLAKRMRKREAKGNVAKAEAYNPSRQMREWMRYTGSSGAPGNAYSAVVTIEMSPKIGETSGSVWGNILGSAIAGASGTYHRGHRRYEFKADFKDVRVERDGVEIPDVMLAKAMVPLEFATSTWSADYSGEDMARIGLFQCNADWFAPDSAGPPKIHVSIISVEKPEKPYEFDLPKATVRRVWEDFGAYRRMHSNGGELSADASDAATDSVVEASAGASDSLNSVESRDAASRAEHSNVPENLSTPYFVRLETGEVIQAVGVVAADYGTIKATLPGGKVKYLNVAKVAMIGDAEGNDLTHEVIDRHKRIGIR